MKNIKPVLEQEILIKEEEMINLGEKNKLELKNIKQNINKATNYKSKKEKIILNEGEVLQLKIDRNEKIPLFKDKKLIRNDLNYKLKKVNIKRKIFKYNIIIIRYIIIINSFIHLILNNNRFLIGANFSNIIKLKINGTGYNYILNTDKDYFREDNYPNIININEKQYFNVSNNYYFDKDDNFVELIWNNSIDECSGMFYGCSNITEIDLSNFDTSNDIDMSFMFSGCSQLSS